MGRNRQPREQGRCLFCDGGVTKEHIFAQWVDDSLPPRAGDIVHSANYGAFAYAGQAISRIITEKQGDVTVIFVRKACKRCNSGWMGALDEAARAVVPKMLTHLTFGLTATQLLTLARWAALKSALIDAKTPEFTAVPRADCIAMRKTEMPPPHWGIWLSRCPTFGERQVGIEHRCLIYDSPPKLKKRAQTTTIRLGEVVMFVLYSPDQPMVDVFRDLVRDNGLLIEIWPKPVVNPIWPVSFRPMSDDELIHLIEALGSFVEPGGVQRRAKAPYTSSYE